MQNKHKKAAWFGFCLGVATLFLTFLLAWQVRAQDADSLQNSIESLEKKLEKQQAEKKNLEADLSQIQQSVTVTQATINKTSSLIRQTEAEVARKEQETKLMEEKLRVQKEMLEKIVQDYYYIKKLPLAGVLISEKTLSETYDGANQLLAIQDKLLEVAAEVKKTKTEIEEQKIQLETDKQAHEKLLTVKQQQQQQLLADKKETQSDLAEAEATIEELQDKLAELQGDLNVLTGKSFKAGDIREAVEYASGKTGVPEGVLYGFLKMETNLGANTGQCTYDQVEKVAVARYKKYGSKYKKSIALLYSRKELFYDLVEDLGYGKNKKVSCSPSGYIGQGGAMGIPQFMSDVWNSYSGRIAANTGHKTPDPWDITDGVMAMAIKLKGAGATSNSTSVIKKASINYLGTFHAPYYSGIVYWSKNYKRLFE